jgi:nucleoside recognition membrane protein YjiH
MDWLTIIPCGIALPVLLYCTLIIYSLVESPSKAKPGSKQYRRGHNLAMKILSPFMVIFCLFLIFAELLGWW